MAPHIAAMMRHMIEKVPPDLSRFLIAPMPGLLTRLEVRPGDKVEPGQPVAVVEAMKMETTVYAERAGTIAEVPVQVGTQVETGDLLIRFEG